MSEKTPPPAPSALQFLLEGRAFAEYALHWFAKGRVKQLPRGDGHPVLVVPGFGAHDVHTIPLRRALADLGYASYGWELGFNAGMRPQIKEKLRLQLEKLGAHHRAKVTLIGWSLGGVYVREMARHQPELVRHVFTLGSPINVHPGANNLMGAFRLLNRGKPVKMDLEGFRRHIVAPPVPCTAIYTKSDGIIAWPCCLEAEGPNTDNVEVRGSHMGLPTNFAVLKAIATRLAQPAR